MKIPLGDASIDAKDNTKMDLRERWELVQDRV